MQIHNIYNFFGGQSKENFGWLDFTNHGYQIGTSSPKVNVVIT
jgi:hypothetical protein